MADPKPPAKSETPKQPDAAGGGGKKPQIKMVVTKSADDAPPDPRTAMLRLAGWAVLIIALGYIAYMIFIGTDPRREFKTVEDTVAAYTEFVRGYTGVTAPLPDPSIISEYLRFFDTDSRKFFDENYRHMAEFRLDTRTEDFAALQEAGQRGHAMLLLVNTPPLQGFSRVVAKRTAADGSEMVEVQSGPGPTYQIRMILRDGLWYITDLGGAKDLIERQITPFRQKAQEKRK